MLREAEVHISQGDTVAQACKKINVSEQAYYRWRKKYGGLKMDQAKRLKDLESENARLKKLVADLSLDNAFSRKATRETTDPGETTSGLLPIFVKSSTFLSEGLTVYWVKPDRRSGESPRAGRTNRG